MGVRVMLVRVLVGMVMGVLVMLMIMIMIMVMVVLLRRMAMQTSPVGLHRRANRAPQLKPIALGRQLVL